jgi:hypothetical protein
VCECVYVRVCVSVCVCGIGLTGPEGGLTGLTG